MGDIDSGGSTVALQHVLTDLKSLNGQIIIKSVNGECNTGVNIMTELSNTDNHSAGDSEMNELDNRFKVSREEIMEDTIDSSHAEVEPINQPSDIPKLGISGDNCNRISDTNKIVADTNGTSNGSLDDKVSTSVESTNGLAVGENETDTVDGEFTPTSPKFIQDEPLAINGLSDISEDDEPDQAKQTGMVKSPMTLENCESDSENAIEDIKLENSTNHEAQCNTDIGNDSVPDGEQESISYSKNSNSENGNLYNDENAKNQNLGEHELPKHDNEESIISNKTHLTEKKHFLIGDKVRHSLQGLMNKVSKLSSSANTSNPSTDKHVGGEKLDAVGNVEIDADADMDAESDKNDTNSGQQDEHKSELGDNDESSQETMEVIDLDSSQDEKEFSEENDDHSCDIVLSDSEQSKYDTSVDGFKPETENPSESGASMTSVPTDTIKLKENGERLVNTDDETKEADDVLLAPGVDDDTFMEIGSDNEDDLLKEGSNTDVAGSSSHEKMDDDSDIIIEKEVKASDNSSTGTETNALQMQQNENKMTNNIDNDGCKFDKKPTDMDLDDDVIFESETKAEDEQKNSDTANNDKTQTSEKIEETKLADRKNENKNADGDDDDDDDDVIFESEEKGNSINNISNIAPVTVKNDNTTTREYTNNMSEATSTNNDKIMSDDSDDDIIFEGETKAQAIINSGQAVESKITSESTHTDNKGIVKTELIKKQEGECKIKPDTEEYANKNNSSIKIDDKDEKPEIKGSITKTETDSKDADQCIKLNIDRKRPPSDTKDPTETDPKRSRLDLVIGKLGSAIGIAPDSVEVLDSDNDDEEDDVADTTAVEKSGESASSEEEEKDESDDEEDSDDDDKTKYIKITESELDQLVREKVTGYLTTQRDTLIAQLQQKVKDLQISNDNWKAQVKDLQVKVNDVTVLQQKHEKRKAATAALRSITSRTVGVQVDDGKTANAEKLAQQRAAVKPAVITQQVTPTRPTPVLQNPLISALPGSGGTIRLPISQGAPVQSVLASQLTSPPSAMPAMNQARAPSVKSLLDQTRQQPTAIPTPPVTTTSATTSSVNVVQYPQRFITPNGTQGYIIHTPPQNTIKSPPLKPTPPSATTNLTPPGFKIIDLTADDDILKATPRVVTLPAPATAGVITSVPGSSAQQIVFTPAMSSPLVRAALPALPQQAYQLVFNSSSPALRNPTVVSGVTTLPPTMLAVPQQTTVPASVAATSVVSATRSLIPAVASSPVSILPAATKLQHPAPFPPLPLNQKTVGLKSIPPKPSLKISRVSQGIVLSWNMTVNNTYAEISNYQLFAYQETVSAPNTTLWKKVGDVKALPLPMACTLTQFQVGNKYHFAVRAMDSHSRVGLFSDASSIHLTPLVTK